MAKEVPVPQQENKIQAKAQPAERAVASQQLPLKIESAQSAPGEEPDLRPVAAAEPLKVPIKAEAQPAERPRIEGRAVDPMKRKSSLVDIAPLCPQREGGGCSRRHSFAGRWTCVAGNSGRRCSSVPRKQCSFSSSTRDGTFVPARDFSASAGSGGGTSSIRRINMAGLLFAPPFVALRPVLLSTYPKVRLRVAQASARLGMHQKSIRHIHTPTAICR